MDASVSGSSQRASDAPCLLLSYILFTMDKYVENDYTIVYFHHGLTSANRPGTSLVMKLYKEMDRK